MKPTTNLVPFPRELREKVSSPVCMGARGLYLFVLSYCGSRCNLKVNPGHAKCKSYHLSKLTLCGGVLSRAA